LLGRSSNVSTRVFANLQSRFQYTWENKEFIVYYVKWQNPFESMAKWFYVLHPRAGSEIVDGHCAATDALVLAAGKWTSQLHDEIFVYDNGYWEKSKELWKSVEGASWDDVVLNPEMKKNLIEECRASSTTRASTTSTLCRGSAV
jgi:transitional endoplasmic reticulum ATPase